MTERDVFETVIKESLENQDIESLLNEFFKYNRLDTYEKFCLQFFEYTVLTLN